MPPTTKSKAATNGHATVEPVSIQKLDKRHAFIPIVGETELIVHNFSEKEKTKMRELQAQKVKKKKEPKDPAAEYEASMYIMEDGKTHGFPAVGFKSAIVGGSRFFDGITMTAMKLAIHVRGEGPGMLVPIIGEPKMREDMVRLATGVADLRYRASYWPWEATLEVIYAANLISLEGIVNLTNAGGMGGVGEWRPSAPKSMTGIYGTFTVKESEVNEVAAS